MKKFIPVGVNLIPDEAKCVFKGEIFDVYQWNQKLYDGTFAVYEQLKRQDTVNVFAIVDNKVIVLEDEQPHRKMLLALPGGRTDPTDSSTLVAIQRETEEETGYTFANWKLIDVVKPIEKMEWFIYTYIAWGDHETGETHTDGGERIKVTLRSFDEVKALAEAGEERLKFEDKLAKAKSLEELIQTEEFKGQEVDR